MSLIYRPDKSSRLHSNWQPRRRRLLRSGLRSSGVGEKRRCTKAGKTTVESREDVKQQVDTDVSVTLLIRDAENDDFNLQMVFFNNCFVYKMGNTLSQSPQRCLEFVFLVQITLKTINILIRSHRKTANSQLETREYLAYWL